MLVYKFRMFDQKGYSIDALQRSQLWCSHRSAFNDPFEFQHEIDRHPADIDAVFDSWMRIYPEWRGKVARKMVPIGIAEIVTDYVDKVGVCCFTTEPRNVLMWSHYADSHRGFCLGFEFGEERKPGFISSQDIFPVKYQDDCPHFNVNVFAQKPYAVFDAALPFLTSKETRWGYENEFRYLHTASNAMVSYEPESLKEIIVGANAKVEDVAELRRVCKSVDLRVTMREALVIPRSYELGIRDL
jgi:DUF2971 family protein